MIGPVRTALAVGVVSLSLAGCASVRNFIAHPLGTDESQAQGAAHTIAVLPFAYRTDDYRTECDMCPHGLVMAKTSERDARLVTALFYEALNNYPRFRIIPYRTVERHQHATMEDTVASLHDAQPFDVAVVGALLEVRDRIGDPRAPYRLGGASVYAAALAMPGGEPIWVQLFDGTKYPDHPVVQGAQRLMGWKDNDRQPTAEEIAEHGVKRLVKSMAKGLP